jgi:hypothetical protein
MRCALFIAVILFIVGCAAVLLGVTTALEPEMKAATTRVRLTGDGNSILCCASMLIVVFALGAVLRDHRGRGRAYSSCERTRDRSSIQHTLPLALRGILRTGCSATVPLGSNSITFGRDPNASQIVFNAGDRIVSKRHCTLRYSPRLRAVVIEDCGSKNGTFLQSGERLMPHQKRLLPADSRFYLGDRGHSFEIVEQRPVCR